MTREKENQAGAEEMRQEIEEILAKLENSVETAVTLAALDKLEASPEEWEEISDRVRDSAEKHRIEALMLEEQAHREEEEADRFTAWIDATGRPETTTYDEFLRETDPVAWQAAQDWCNGPHSPEEQVYLDALDEVSSLRDNHEFYENELIDTMVRRMGPEFDGKDKVAVAKRIMARHDEG